ncbi:hypothetical protein [Marinobacter nauticus]|uniref:Uncharacterized protein n=1 Tax=Marinobacter nauticus TaxID=2743 RepID=A0A833JR63_MARNT|nr:hypothetical protein [Marinobacter nauticus]KAE8546599.1 hypothetical protein F6453_0840 [Marinobacter nauticus]
MTLVVAWTRKTNEGKELWVMSDSRLSGGKVWDYGPKIFGIGRSDAVMAFAGDTAWSYPLIAQITSYVESFVNLRDRAIDFIDAQDQIIKMLNESLTFVSEAVDQSLERPDCSFILAGYSARRKGFVVNKIVFHLNRLKFEARSARKIAGELMAVIGDKSPVSAISRRISQRQKQQGDTKFKLDMLPSEAFFDVLSSNRFSEIGGAPQVSKVYQSMNQRHFGVYWPPDIPTDQQHIYLRGRQLGNYEVLDHPWVFDPSEGALYWHDFSPEERRAKLKAEKKEQFAIVDLLNRG